MSNGGLNRSPAVAPIVRPKAQRIAAARGKPVRREPRLVRAPLGHEQEKSCWATSKRKTEECEGGRVSYASVYCIRHETPYSPMAANAFGDRYTAACLHHSASRAYLERCLP